jgi:hypothetical protein
MQRSLIKYSNKPNIYFYPLYRNGKNKKKKFDGGYVFGDFVTGLSDHVFDKIYKGRKLVERQAYMQQAKKEADIEQSRVQEKASATAAGIWKTATPLVSHEYLSRKHVSFFNCLKEYKGCVAIPLCDENGKFGHCNSSMRTATSGFSRAEEKKDAISPSAIRKNRIGFLSARARDRSYVVRVHFGSRRRGL